MNDRRKFLNVASFGLASIIVPADQPRSSEEWEMFLSACREREHSESFWEMVKQQFLFEEGLTYFNNASLGGCPKPVVNATNAFRATLDAYPSKYMWGGWDDAKEEVRRAVADFFSVSSEEIALIHNTTEAMNLMARSFDLQAGDEVILADHEHKSTTIPWEVWQKSKGIKLVRLELPILPESPDELARVYESMITPKTKVISMCHIVNTNGMILPVKSVSQMAHQRNILVGVDGAQSAGMMQIDLGELGCDFYAASAHKWLFAPKGIGILYAKKESQQYLRPLVVARGHNDESIRRLENYNTRNLPEVLALGAAIEFANKIGQQKIEARTFELKAYFRTRLSNNPKFRLKTPASNTLSGAIQVVEIVGQKAGKAREKLFDEYGIDCRPMNSFGLNALRFSLAIFITRQDIDYLVDALERLT